MNNLSNDINAYILAGGQSRRFNTDKSLVQINGKTLTQIIHERLSPIFNNTYIVGKENNFLNYNFIKDVKPVQCPLNGIVTALEHSKNDWIFVIACDLPLVSESIVNGLYNNINPTAQIILPTIDDNLQPLCAFYHKSVLKDFNNAVEKGEYSLMKLLDQFDVTKISIPSKDEEQFLNINYQEDLEEAKRFLN